MAARPGPLGMGPSQAHFSLKFSDTRAAMPPPMGDRLGVAVGLMGSEDPADSAFWESRGEETTKSPPVWPSEPSYGGTKIFGDPVQSMCSQGVLAVPLLASILRS